MDDAATIERKLDALRAIFMALDEAHVESKKPGHKKRSREGVLRMARDFAGKRATRAELVEALNTAPGALLAGLIRV